MIAIVTRSVSRCIQICIKSTSSTDAELLRLQSAKMMIAYCNNHIGGKFDTCDAVYP